MKYKRNRRFSLGDQCEIAIVNSVKTQFSCVFVVLLSSRPQKEKTNGSSDSLYQTYHWIHTF